MSSTLERMASLGKHRRPITITVAGESVELIYQRPTKIKDAQLRAAIQEEWKANKEMIRTPDSTGESAEDRFRKTLKGHGKENIIAWLVLPKMEGLKAQARKELKDQGIDVPSEDASAEEIAAYDGQGKEILDPLVADAKTEFESQDFEDLLDLAAALNTDKLAFDRAEENYYARLIADSIYDPETNQVLFAGPQVVLETLTEAAFSEIGRMIDKEMEAQKGLPLT